MNRSKSRIALMAVAALLASAASMQVRLPITIADTKGAPQAPRDRQSPNAASFPRSGSLAYGGGRQ
jgi:hypothetical protein